LPFLITKNGVARGDGQLRQTGEVIDQTFRETIGQIFQVLDVIRIHERQNSDGMDFSRSRTQIEIGNRACSRNEDQDEKQLGYASVSADPPCKNVE
jgi:hypothetical protein